MIPSTSVIQSQDIDLSVWNENLRSTIQLKVVRVTIIKLKK